MPTYQYRCTDCGRDLEVVQKFSDTSLTVCPTCAGTLRKVFNAVGVVFKGSGFYRNDSRAASKDTSESGGSDKKSESSGEKPAEKAEKAGKNAPATADAGSGAGKSSSTSDSGTSSPQPSKVGANGSSSTGTKAAAN